MDFRNLVVFVAFIASVLPHGVSQSVSLPIETTVCDVAADPLRFADKLIQLKAHFESDGIERSILTNSNCKDVGIVPFTPKHFKGEAALDKALGKGRPGTLDKTITGTFTGVFRWKPKNDPKRIIELTEVTDVSLVMK